MFKLFHSESKTIIGAATLVGFFSLVSRLFGFIRDRILAGAFGAGDTLDVYYAAFKVPDFIFNLIVVGALSASFIPIFTKYYSNTLSKKRAWIFTSAILRIVGIGMLCLTIGLFIFSHQVAQLIAPGFDAGKQAQVADFTRVMIFSEVLLALSMIFGSVLQSTKRFFLYSLAPIFYNVGIIVGALVFVKWFGAIGLALGVVFGAMLHLFIQWFGARKAGFHFHYHVADVKKDTQEMLRLTGPRMIGIGINQILFLILMIIATTLPSGSVTIFQFAYNIEFFPVGIFGVAYAIASFPSLAEAIAHNKLKEFREILSSTVRQLFFFMIPTTIVFLLLRAQIVRLVVGAGAFDWHATILAADTLAFFALTFVAQSTVYILARAFFAIHDTVTPLTAGLTSAVLGIVSAFLFTREFGVVGLAIAFALSETINAGLLWILLRQKMGSLDESKILKSLFRMIAASLLTALVIQGVKTVTVYMFPLDSFISVFIQATFATLAGGVTYLLVSFLLRSEELKSLISSLNKSQLKEVKTSENFSANDGSGTL